MDKIVLASGNQGKIRELGEMLKESGVEVLSLADFPEIGDIEETGATFQENAALKAKTVAQATGLITLADDSGLEVDHLNGAPGVYSARFAGGPKDDRRNNEKLLQLLAGVPQDKRTARFRCVIAIATPIGEAYFAEGECEGMIIEELRGAKGFGYDPLFYVPELGKTMSELDLDIKNEISHRGRALQKAKIILEDLLRLC